MGDAAGIMGNEEEEAEKEEEGQRGRGGTWQEKQTQWSNRMMECVSGFPHY